MQTKAEVRRFRIATLSTRRDPREARLAISSKRRKRLHVISRIGSARPDNTGLHTVDRNARVSTQILCHLGRVRLYHLQEKCLSHHQSLLRRFSESYKNRY